MHRTIDPAILYFGTPVVVVSTLNADGSANLAPMSSAWWLGRFCVLGFDATSKTPENLLRTGECVLNLPSEGEAELVNRLALTTGTDPLPPHKIARGYRFEPDKFTSAGATPLPSECVGPPRVAECPVHLEARLTDIWHPGAADPAANPAAARTRYALCVRIVRVHAEERVLLSGPTDRIDPERWRPLVMSFQRFFGLGGEVMPSRLATVPEEAYRPRSAAPSPQQGSR